jgi:hypothetical protein
MTTDAPTLPVTVTLAPTCFVAVESAADSVCRRVEVELSELTANLGVHARPVVELEADNATVADEFVRVFVHRVQCPFFRPALAEALAYAEGTPRIAIDTDAVLEHLLGASDSNAERISEVLALVACEAVSGQPRVLLGPTTDDAAHAPLDLGMSIAGRGEGAQDPVSERGEPDESLIATLAARTIDIHVDPEYLRLLTSADPRAEQFPLLRDGLFVELGLPLPPFHFRPDPSLRPRGFAFRINAIRTLPRIGLSPGTLLVNESTERLAEHHSVDGEPTLNPATYKPGALVNGRDKEALEKEGLTTWDSFEFLVLSLAAAVRRRAHALMTRDVAAAKVQELGYVFPALGAAASTYAAPDSLAPVLRELLLDAVPIRNLRRILELLIRDQTADGPSDRRDRTAFVRAGMADLIAHNAARGTATIVTYLLDPQIEDALARGNALPAGGEEPLPERLRAAVRAELAQLPPTALVPALLTQDEVRRPLRDLLRHEFPQMRVLGYGDLPPERNVQPVARISWAPIAAD